ncbi:Proteasome inhibitor-related [Gossypium australe]|uniref:Proteasome inhibitor-related n=1 Tax=Gossypium australe TaxID=47621 RepID=A0A5B6V3N1_9ROSI|nr:Proteasome inhibitor-related [Gossypium australe]
MEAGKGTESSSPSITTQLFGSKEPPSSSNEVLRALLSPQSKVSGGRYFRPGMVALPQDSLNVPQNAKPTTNGEVRSAENGRVGSIYQEQRVEPCHLSSSIYYGGQDIYIRSHSDQDSGLNDDSEEDESGYASRGNWWQGMVV